MKTITVKNLSLQFDSYHDIEDIEEYIRSTLELINLSLQREPYDLSAQLVESEVLEYTVETQDEESDDEDEDY